MIILCVCVCLCVLYFWLLLISTYCSSSVGGFQKLLLYLMEVGLTLVLCSWITPFLKMQRNF